MFAIDNAVENRQQPVCKRLSGYGCRAKGEKVSIVLKLFLCSFFCKKISSLKFALNHPHKKN